MKADSAIGYFIICHKDTAKLSEISADNAVFHSVLALISQNWKRVALLFVFSLFVVFFNDPFKGGNVGLDKIKTLLAFKL